MSGHNGGNNVRLENTHDDSQGEVSRRACHGARTIAVSRVDILRDALRRTESHEQEEYLYLLASCHVYEIAKMGWGEARQRRRTYSTDKLGAHGNHIILNIGKDALALRADVLGIGPHGSEGVHVV